MEINLIEDWHKVMEQELSGLKCAKAELLDIEHQYFNCKARLLNTKPRQVMKAQEFSCPKEWEKGLNKIIHKLQNGSDMRSHMDIKASLDETAEDFLLADWGIYAFKLKKRVSGDKEEVGPTLYAYFDDVTAYLLTTKNDDEWTVQELLSILANNWPKTLEQYKISGITGLSAEFASQEYTELRKRNKNIVISLAGGNAYYSTKASYDSEGKRQQFTVTIDKIKRYIEKMQTAMTKEADAVLNRIQKESKQELKDIKIVLGRDKEGYAYIAEAQTKIVLTKTEGLF